MCVCGCVWVCVGVCMHACMRVFAQVGKVSLTHCASEWVKKHQQQNNHVPPAPELWRDSFEEDPGAGSDGGWEGGLSVSGEHVRGTLPWQGRHCGSAGGPR